MRLILRISCFFLIFVKALFADPALFFREDWAESPYALPITQDHVANPDLELGLYGVAVTSLKKSHHDNIPDDPYYVWSGECRNGLWAASLQHLSAFVDLSHGKIRWRSRQSGEHYLRIILKTSSGNWMISEQSNGPSADWQVVEFKLDTLGWHVLDIGTLQAGNIDIVPDLSEIDEIGFTDLKKGAGSNSSSRVDWIEVYGDSVSRTTAVESNSKQSMYDAIQIRAYPNPFNALSVVSYHLSVGSRIQVTVYNVTGQKIQFMDFGYEGAGEHQFTWTADHVPSGIYFIHLHADRFMATHKVFLIK